MKKLVNESLGSFLNERDESNYLPSFDNLLTLIAKDLPEDANGENLIQTITDLYYEFGWEDSIDRDDFENLADHFDIIIDQDTIDFAYDMGFENLVE